jgi:hypothetical protein
MEECRGGAKLAPFCRRVESLFVKLPPKEVLRKPLEAAPPTTQTKKLKPKPN